MARRCSASRGSLGDHGSSRKRRAYGSHEPTPRGRTTSPVPHGKTTPLSYGGGGPSSRSAKRAQRESGRDLSKELPINFHRNGQHDDGDDDADFGGDGRSIDFGTDDQMENDTSAAENIAADDVDKVMKDANATEALGNESESGDVANEREPTSAIAVRQDEEKLDDASAAARPRACAG